MFSFLYVYPLQGVEAFKVNKIASFIQDAYRMNFHNFADTY